MIELCAGKRWQRERQLFSSSLSVAMSFSPAFDRPLPRIEASLRWRTNKERLFRCAAIRSPVAWQAKRCEQRNRRFTIAPTAARRLFDLAETTETRARP